MRPAVSLSAMRFLLTLLVLISGLMVTEIRSETQFESPETRVALVELFTSEGCSSCPPAEAWLGSLTNRPGLWKEFVPVAFHVTYWDDLGWPDRFASTEFTQRQKAYSAQWNSQTVYTPAFVLNGAEWRPTGNLPKSSGEKAGRLRLRVTKDGTIEVTFTPLEKNSGPLLVEVAALGHGVNTTVKRGENRGRNLRHDFVALALVRAELVPADSGTFETRISLPQTTSAPASAVAAWVRSPDSPAPLQATGGWLPATWKAGSGPEPQ